MEIASSKAEQLPVDSPASDGPWDPTLETLTEPSATSTLTEGLPRTTDGVLMTSSDMTMSSDDLMSSTVDMTRSWLSNTTTATAEMASSFAEMTTQTTDQMTLSDGVETTETISYDTETVLPLKSTYESITNTDSPASVATDSTYLVPKYTELSGTMTDSNHILSTSTDFSDSMADSTHLFLTTDTELSGSMTDSTRILSTDTELSGSMTNSTRILSTDAELSGSMTESISLYDSSPSATDTAAMSSIPSPMVEDATIVTTAVYPTSTLKEPASTKLPQASKKCHCIVGPSVKRNITLDISKVQEMTSSIQRELTVNHSTLSRSVRKKISATDNRVSATAVGSLGVVILSGALGLITASDILDLWRKGRSSIGPKAANSPKTHHTKDECVTKF
ncbi:hypothetical protein ACOMHN_040773 [Nucella lapillus]